MSQPQKRLATLDVMRGFALLGILIMNIQSFSMPGAAYINPAAYGDLNGINLLVWMVSHVFADLKFLTLFSMLFGAGIILFCENATKKGANAKALHFKRMLGLFIFGLVHSYFFWYGDILFFYSICGFIAYFFRGKSIKFLLIGSIALMLIPSVYSLFMGFSLKYLPQEVLRSISENWKPSAVNIEQEISDYLGGFVSALQRRTKTTIFMQTYLFLSMFLWRITGAMFIGMALYKSRFFHLEWRPESYKKLFFITFPIGLVITLIGLVLLISYDFSFEYTMFIGNQFNFWGSLFLTVSYTTGVVLFVKSLKGLKTQEYLAAIGRTAFSNYFLQTLICTTIFYGYGFGFYGQIERWQQVLLVFAIWFFQLWLSPLWLKRFCYGPMEWLWRSFTYWKLQPMKYPPKV